MNLGALFLAFFARRGAFDFSAAHFQKAIYNTGMKYGKIIHHGNGAKNYGGNPR
jgi:hypothetical protein